VAPLISVLCPTRNRPELVRRMTESALDMARGEVELVFYADDDAPRSVPDDIAALPEVTVVTGPRIVLSDTWNKCMAAASADIFMESGDDCVFRTPGWDEAVEGAFAEYPDRIALVYGDDMIWGEKLSSHSFVHRRWTEALGYIAPPWFSADCCDAWLYDVAGMIGRRRFLPGVITEHLHPSVGKGSWDRTHLERLERARRDNVAALYRSLAARREQDAARLRAVMS
jgi:Glycosyl transferase family 2